MGSQSPSATPKEDKVKSAFFQAAKTGNQSKLLAYQDVLDDGLAARDSEGNTALHHAAAQGHLELVKWLVKEQEQDASNHNEVGDTPLLLAARHGKQAIVEWLIELGGVDSSERNQQGSSALLLAAEQGHLSLVAWLLENGHSSLIEEDHQKKTLFSSPSQIVVLWASLYQMGSNSKDVEKSQELESIIAYQGTEAKQLHFMTAKILVRFNAQKLLESYQETLKGWWSGFSLEEQSAVPKLKEVLYPIKKEWLYSVKPVKIEPPQSAAQTKLVMPVVFHQKTPQVSPVQTSATLSPVMPASASLSGVFTPSVELTTKASGGTQHILSYPGQVEQISKAIQDKIYPEELKALFKWVTEGHLIEVEKLLNKNSTLGLGTLTVTDLSDRTFNNITALQYAAWCLDEEMADLIMRYLGAHHSAMQLKALYDEPGRYSDHGSHYDIKPLIQKTQTYLDNYSKWSIEECKRYWQKEVGGEQRKCPAWLIYAWCEEGYDVAWVTNFNRKYQWSGSTIKV